MFYRHYTKEIVNAIKQGYPQIVRDTGNVQEVDRLLKVYNIPHDKTETQGVCKCYIYSKKIRRVR